MPSIYCGNNLNYSGIVNGTHRLGTNLECLRIGIGKGLNMPVDPEYANEYIPNDDRKYYCGNEQQLPANGNYHDFGSPPKCLAIGIGVGKSRKANEGVAGIEPADEPDNDQHPPAILPKTT